MIVLFTHVERLRVISGMPTLIDPAFNSFLGGVAVTFFFVLSGFLITMLLLAEKSAEGTIRIKRFLVNRALRIWPLYYLTLAAGYAISILVLKDTDPDPLRNGLLLNALFLPNLVFVTVGLPDLLVQLWSIGTEEQFYLVWPFLVRRLSLRQLSRLFLGILLFWAAARGISRLCHAGQPSAFLFRTRIDCMAIGGFAALLLFYVERASGWWTTAYRLILHPNSGWAAATAFIGLLLISKHYDISLYPCYALLFAIGCLRVTGIPVRWLEYAPLRYLGKISYGIYLLHQFVLFFLFKTWFVHHPMGDIGIFLLAATGTAGLAAFSYTFFESFFLRRRSPSRGPKPS